MARWIKGLPADEKNGCLLRLLTEEGTLLLQAELSRQFREATAPRGKPAGSTAWRRTIRQLLKARDSIAERRAREAAELAAKEKAERTRKKAEERAKYLDGLARREAEAWREVDDLIATKQPKGYDQAVDLLVALRELAERAGRTAKADARILELRQEHAKKPSLLKRFDMHDLGK